MSIGGPHEVLPPHAMVTSVLRMRSRTRSFQFPENGSFTDQF